MHTGTGIDNLINKKKIDVAKRKLDQIGNDSDITTFKKKVNKKNIDSLVKKFEIILDCSDNFQTRYLINNLQNQRGLKETSQRAHRGPTHWSRRWRAS